MLKGQLLMTRFNLLNRTTDLQINLTIKGT